MHKRMSVVLAVAVLGVPLATADAQGRAHHRHGHHHHHRYHYHRHHHRHHHHAARKGGSGRFSRAKGLDTQPPSAPSNLSAAAGNQEISLTWTPSTDNVAVGGYRIYRNNHKVAAVGASTLTYTNTGLTSGTTYSYYVVAYDTSGNVSAPSNTVSATPVALTATAEPSVSTSTTTETTAATTSTTEPSSTITLVSTAGLPPYELASSWNTPIGSSPVVDPLSATYMNAIANNGLPLTSDPDEYTIPVYTWNASTPMFTVTGSGYFHSYDAGDDYTSVGHGSPWSITGVPIPPGATGGAGSDGQIVLLNPETGVEYEFWQFYQASDGSYHATNGAESHTTSGYYGRFGDGLAGRGDGTPYLAGLVRRWEVEQGHIDHAIAFAYDSPSGAYVYPASKSDGGNFGGVLSTDAPEGTRIQLDPGLTEADFEAWGLSPMARIIARSLQKYGMIVVDHSGSSKIYLEDRTTARWESTVTRSLVSAIPWSAFRVVDMPAGPA